MNTYEIKIGKNWTKVKGESIIAIDSYCNKNNIKNWRMVGMQSISELKANQFLKVIYG